MVATGLAAKHGCLVKVGMYRGYQGWWESGIHAHPLLSRRKGRLGLFCLSHKGEGQYMWAFLPNHGHHSSKDYIEICEWQSSRQIYGDQTAGWSHSAWGFRISLHTIPDDITGAIWSQRWSMFLLNEELKNPRILKNHRVDIGDMITHNYPLDVLRGLGNGMLLGIGTNENDNQTASFLQTQEVHKIQCNCSLVKRCNCSKEHRCSRGLLKCSSARC